jgi:hypothetical protein
MKQKINFFNKETAEAALAEAKAIGWSAEIVDGDGGAVLEYESLASYADEPEKSKAASEEEMYNIYRSLSQEMEYRFKWMNENIDGVRKMFFDHAIGHLPPIKDAGKMSAALKSLGLEDSFEVRKPSVYIEW